MPGFVLLLDFINSHCEPDPVLAMYAIFLLVRPNYGQIRTMYKLVHAVQSISVSRFGQL